MNQPKPETPNPETTTCTFSAFRLHNSEDPDALEAVAALRAGEHALLGGGAAPLVRVTRLNSGLLEITSSEAEPAAGSPSTAAAPPTTGKTPRADFRSTASATLAQLHTIALNRALLLATSGRLAPPDLKAWSDQMREYIPEMRHQATARAVSVDGLMDGFRLFLRQRLRDPKLQSSATPLYWRHARKKRSG